MILILFVTDFSSIIFEYIYQKKPFVIIIPDGKDPKINQLYRHDYFNLLKDLKSGKIGFKNKFFDISILN